MPRAICNGQIIAESERTIVLDGVHYFPQGAVRSELLRTSSTRRWCPDQGEARYYHLVIGDTLQRDAAWYFPSPAPSAGRLAGHVAFGSEVEVVQSEMLALV
ncbi:MAG: DUF427 domain-containing protein [Phycisphaerae bacterium]|nr:DUF427 domain-containing protein [Phycisphaerae bacterium]